MAVIELNREGIEILSISHSMSRASVCRFKINIIHGAGSDTGEPADIGDSDAEFALGDAHLLDVRQEVRYTADDGTVLFAGKVLPASRNISTSNEGVEYTAADHVESLGNNPADVVNKHYNRNNNDSMVFEYPSDQSIENIVELEFERIVGSASNSDHVISSIDWSKAEDIRNFVVLNFTTEGKTWLQILDDLRNEIPMLAYWLDPRTCTRSGDIRGYTLRFYNLSPQTTGDDSISDNERVRIVTPMRDGLASNSDENVLQFRFNEDISQSYDKLTLKAWGHLYERYEKMELGWDSGSLQSGSFSNPDEYPSTFSNKTVHPLRFNSETQTWERYSDSAGRFLTSPGTLWTPDRDTADARRAFRRYKIPNKPDGELRRAINMKFDIENLPNGDTQLIQVGPATQAYTLSHVWYVGALTFTVGGNVYVGFLIDSVKHVVFTGGLEDDFGEVNVSQTYYPDYPDGPDGLNSDPVPLFAAPPVQMVEENMILLEQPLIRETGYIFTGNIDGGGWNAMMNERVSCFWGAGYDLWASYTAWDELEAVRENNTLGYEKEMVLYEPRFFKYTKLDGTVIRDDTVLLNEFANILFELITKPRYTGSATLDVTDISGGQVFNNRSGQRDIFMGAPVQIENWKPGAQYTLFKPKVLIQSLELAKYDTENTVQMGFDNPQTFIPLEKTQTFRAFFEDAFDGGVGGTNSNGGCGCGPGTPDGGGGGGGPGGGGGGGGGTTEPPVSTGTDGPATTTGPTASTGTTATNSSSDTTPDDGSTTPDDGGSTTTTESTTGGTSSASVTMTSWSSTIAIQSEVTTIDVTGVQADKQVTFVSLTTVPITTPIPAQQFTGLPLDLD